MMLSKTDDSGKSNRGVNPTPWLLFGVLAFVEKQLGANQRVLVLSESRSVRRRFARTYVYSPLFAQ